jgi:hypothetical protein
MDHAKHELGHANTGTLWYHAKRGHSVVIRIRILWWHAKCKHYGVLVLQRQGHCDGMQNRDTIWFILTAKTKSLWWFAKKGHYGVLVLQKTRTQWWHAK